MKRPKKKDGEQSNGKTAAGARPRPRARQPRVPLANAQQYLAAIEGVYNDLRSGGITSDVAKSRAYVLQVGAGILRCTIMELRLDDLAEKVAKIEGSNGL